MKLPINYNTSHWRIRRQAREQYIQLQQGKCYHCGKPLEGPPAENVASKPINSILFPKNFFKYPVHLHHDHKSGITIGAVHNKCNAVLWQYYGK
jgi:hypothetical protein